MPSTAEPSGGSAEDERARLDAALHRAARDHGPRVLSILAARFGDLDLADDAVQEALIAANASWPTSGVPDNVAGWLMTVARRRMLDELRRQGRSAARLAAIAPDVLEASMPATRRDGIVAPDSSGGGEGVGGDEGVGGGEGGGGDEGVGGDERLRLIVLCCHPALDRDAQVALTLRLVAGLTIEEIGAAFLVSPTTLAQRIVRAKRKIREAQIPLSLPAAIDERIDAVLGILYLIFNEGYLSHNEGDPLRPALVGEAIRLTRLVVALAPGSAEAKGLLALELFHQARAASRVDSLGDLVLLDEQDRGRWDRAAIEAGNSVVVAAMSQMSPGPYQLQALIAANHANAPSPEQTDWAMILALYDQLLAITESPVVELNRAVARAMADGPQAGIEALSRIDGLDRYHLFWACRGELEHRNGSDLAAGEAFRIARSLATGEAEQRHLDKRIETLGAGQSPIEPQEAD